MPNWKVKFVPAEDEDNKKPLLKFIFQNAGAEYEIQYPVYEGYDRVFARLVNAMEANKESLSELNVRNWKLSIYTKNGKTKISSTIDIINYDRYDDGDEEVGMNNFKLSLSNDKCLSAFKQAMEYMEDLEFVSDEDSDEDSGEDSDVFYAKQYDNYKSKMEDICWEREEKKKKKLNNKKDI